MKPTSGGRIRVAAGWLSVCGIAAMCAALAQNPVWDGAADRTNFVNGAFQTNFGYAFIMPPGPMAYINDQGVVAITTNFDATGLEPVNSLNFTTYPLQVVETNEPPRVRLYLNATGGVFLTTAAPAEYDASNWVRAVYGNPGSWLAGTNLDLWYADRDPSRQRLTMTLVAEADLTNYLAAVSNAAPVVDDGSGTNVSLLVLYSNDIAVVQTENLDGVLRFMLHAPAAVTYFSIFSTLDLTDTNAWELAASLAHINDPMLFQTLETRVSETSTVWKILAAGDGSLDTDADGLPDAIERLLTHTDPAVTDTDADGLADGQEFLQYASNPNAYSSATNGLSDGWLVANNMDPSAWVDPETLAANGLTFAQLSDMGLPTNAPVIDLGPNDVQFDYRSYSVHAWKVGWIQLDWNKDAGSNGVPRYFRTWIEHVEVDTSDTNDCIIPNLYSCDVEDHAAPDKRFKFGTKHGTFGRTNIQNHCEESGSGYQAFANATAFWTNNWSNGNGTWQGSFTVTDVTGTTNGSGIVQWTGTAYASTPFDQPYDILFEPITWWEGLTWLEQTRYQFVVSPYVWSATNKLENGTNELGQVVRFRTQLLDNEYFTSDLLSLATNELELSPSLGTVGWGTNIVRENSHNYSTLTAPAHSASRYLSGDETNLALTRIQYQIRLPTSSNGVAYRATVAHVYTPTNANATGVVIDVKTFVTNGTGGARILTPSEGWTIDSPASNGAVAPQVVRLAISEPDGLNPVPLLGADTHFRHDPACFEWQYVHPLNVPSNYTQSIIGIVDSTNILGTFKWTVSTGSLNSIDTLAPCFDASSLSTTALLTEVTLTLECTNSPDLTLQTRILEVFRDHLERDFANFGTGISCGNWENIPPWVFSKYGLNVTMPHTWNCFGSVWHAFDGSHEGLVKDTIPVSGFTSNSFISPIVWTNALAGLKRGDIVAFYSPDGQMQHAHTCMGDASQMYGANNEPGLRLDRNPDGSPRYTGTWRWAITSSQTYYDSGNISFGRYTFSPILFINQVVVYRKP